MLYFRTVCLCQLFLLLLYIDADSAKCIVTYFCKYCIEVAQYCLNGLVCVFATSSHVAFPTIKLMCVSSYRNPYEQRVP